MTADQIGWVATAAVGAAMVAQVAGNFVRDKLRPKQTADEITEPPESHGAWEGSMARIVLDPVTRIEGHLRIEAQVKSGMISDAWSSGTMFRGIELILRGRDPREAWIWAQRICGVCTMVHALASVNAVEDALGIEIPDNARLVRNSSRRRKRSRITSFMGVQPAQRCAHHHGHATDAVQRQDSRFSLLQPRRSCRCLHVPHTLYAEKIGGEITDVFSEGQFGRER